MTRPQALAVHSRLRARASPIRLRVDRDETEDAAPAATAFEVAIFIDLRTRDERLAVEVRAVLPLAHGYFASPRATVYSCSYRTQAERILALQRARRFCDERGKTIVHFGQASDRRA